MSLALGLVAFLLAPVLDKGPAPTPTTDLAQRVVDALVADAALEGLELGVHVRCTGDRATWASHDPDALLNPASGAKLLSTAAALSVLSPSHTFVTRLTGRLVDGSASDVALIAAADPSLTIDDLARLAEGVKAAGVRRIAGGLVIDLGVFDDDTSPPSFDTKNTDAGYRPEVPSLAVGSGAFIATVSPAKRVGDPVRVTTSLVASSLTIENDAVTTQGKRIDKLVIEARAGQNGRTRLIVSGSLGLQAPPQGVKKRLADPARVAAELFVRALEKAGVSVDGALRFGPAPDAPELARLESDPLAADVREINTTSNNFMAETVFKHLGADPSKAGPATWERATLRTTEALVALGLAPGSFRVVNGSGLYDGTHVSAGAMTLLLALESGDDAAAVAFRESLAVAGTSGTLKGRLGKKLKGKALGKTGTLDDATSLSGYVPSSRCLLGFSVIANGAIGGRAAAVNRRIDAFVLALSDL